MYRKPTHTGRCLSFDSHHPTSVKCGIVRGFVERAIKVCSDEKSKKGEIGHIMGEMQGNGFLTCHVMVSMALTNQRGSFKGGKFKS